MGGDLLGTASARIDAGVTVILDPGGTGEDGFLGCHSEAITIASADPDASYEEESNPRPLTSILALPADRVALCFKVRCSLRGVAREALAACIVGMQALGSGFSQSG